MKEIKDLALKALLVVLSISTVYSVYTSTTLKEKLEVNIAEAKLAEARLASKLQIELSSASKGYAELQSQNLSLKEDLMLLAMKSQNNTERFENIMSAYKSEEEEKFVLLDIFYGTNRQPISSGNKFNFGKKRSKKEKINLGVTTVSIPLSHEVGIVEQPIWWKFEFSENPNKHIVLKEVIPLEDNSYLSYLKSKLSISSDRSAMIFIHGYNTSFEQAAKRTAQLSYDLSFKGVSAFFSWPSNGESAKYTYDETNAKWSTPHLREFLSTFAEMDDIDNIYIIAHSMGNRVLTESYTNLLTQNPSLTSKFKEVILAAPDIDADVFKNQIAPQMIAFGNPITLYSSSTDKALIASKLVHGHPRAGDAGDEIVILKGIENIDSTNIDSSFFGHSYFADNNTVVADIYYIINNSFRASERATLRKQEHQSGIYWKFKKIQ